MPGLGNDLVVNLAGNNSKLKRSISESKGGLKSFASTATSLLNPITAGLAAVAGSAVGAGVAVYGLTTRIAGLAAVADQATQTGLSGAFIQRLGYAADQSGVSVETLMGGIKKLTIAIGKGDAKPFEALGISLAEMKSLNPEQQFLKVAAAISKLPTAAERAAAAVKIFGKSGVDMTGLFAGGMSDLNALMADAQSLGIGISAEGLAKAAAADDAIQRMKASFGALLDQITVGVAPAFTLIATKIADLMPPLTQFLDKFNSLPDKAQFVGDVMSSSMNLAFEHIKVSWNTLLQDMIRTGGEAAFNIAKKFTLVGQAQAAIDLAKGAAGLARNPLENNGVAAAQAQLDAVLGRLAAPQNNAPPQPAFAGAEPQPADPKGFAAGVLDNIKAQQAQTGDMAGLAAKAKDLFGSLFMGVAKAAQKEIAKGPKGNTTTAFDGNLPPVEKTKQENKLAGAMQKGSTEAYSTIVQSMFRGKDPNVMATETQTKVLEKAIKQNKPPKFAMVKAFA